MKRIFIFILIFSTSSAFALIDFKTLTKKYNKAKKARQLKGGAMDGGGTGGLREENGAAWFYQDKTPNYIRACIKRSQKFKATEKMIQNVILNSFQIWDDYINKSDIYTSKVTDDQGNPYPYNDKLKILTQLKFEKCSKDTELTFYFGVKDQRVKDVLAGLNNPKGFAFRNYEDIDAQKGTSKGIVWIFDPTDTPTDLSDDLYFDWSDTKYLQAIMNHEVGHIMGVGHFENTIMQEDIEHLFILSKMTIDATTPEQTKELILNAKKYLNKIDHKTKLLSKFEFKGESFEGMMGVPGSKELDETFKVFMKRSPIGKVKVKLQITSPDLNKTKYFVTDDLETKEFELTKFERDVTNFSFGTIIPNKFKRVRKTYDAQWDSWDIDSDNEFTFSARLRGKMHIKGMNPVYAILGVNSGVTGYFEKPSDDTTYTSSFSNLSLHFIDQNMKTRIMFVDEVANWEFTEDDETTNTDIITK